MTLTLTPIQRVLAAGCAALFIIMLVLGFEYLDAGGRKAGLERQLATLQSSIDRANAAAASGNGDVFVTDPAFPNAPPNLELASIVLNGATGSGVTTGPLQATTQGTDKIGANTYRTVTMNISISGTLPQILDFFDRVERGGIHTLVFDNIHVDSVAGRWTVQLQLIAYAQPG
jgi:hypothetical protein